ncbi:hypothetical protein IW262DRAFT_1486303 [Armillaria fumosa]|nr:hypothetical protein IW262DRAFT_1486303 [Armillaria fumosa]
MELDQGMSYARGKSVCSFIPEEQSGVYTSVDLELMHRSARLPLTCTPTFGIVIRLDRIFLRGIQPTNGEEHTFFDTTLSGHSSERATRSSKAKELYSATAYLPPPAYTTLYFYIGEDISDGLRPRGVICVDMSTTYEITPAATLVEHGGVIHDPGSIEAGNDWRLPKWSRVGHLNILR